VTGPASGIGPRERRWLVIFLVLGSVYFGFLVADRVLGFLGSFGTILLIVFLAWLLAFVMAPLAAWFQERTGLSRPVAVVVTYLAVLVLFGFGLFYAGAAITQQVAELTRNYPQTERDILATLLRWEEGLHVGRLQVDLTGLYAGAVAQVEALVGEIAQQAEAIAGVTVAALGSFLLIIVLSLYMLMDSRRILGRLRTVVPRRYTEESRLLERSVARAFGGFLRAQIVLAAVQALLVAVVGSAFGVPYLFLWGTLSTLAMLIPFFGPPLALLPPVLGALLFAPDVFLPVTVILVVVQTVLVNWLQPRLMRGALGLHPILVLVGLMIGAQVAGIWGALFGIPIIAVAWVFVSYIAFGTVPNAALPDEVQLSDVEEHVMVSVAKEQVGDETHPHIHVTRTRRADGSEQVELRMPEPPPPRASTEPGSEG